VLPESAKILALAAAEPRTCHSTLRISDIYHRNPAGPSRAISRRMDPLTATAASGLRARMESLELLANNVANASTGGYKADREFYGLYSAPEADSGSTMPVIERPWIDLSQGTIHSTGNSLDVALSGRGFFSVNGPAGPLYTRNGNFRLAADGRMVTAEGYAVRGASGTAVTLQSGRPIEISSDGTIHQDGAVMGKLELVDFTSPDGVEKHGGTYFRATDPALRPVAPAATAVEQGKLEASNSGSAESAVRLISVMRQFEMLQKAVTLAVDMNRQAVEQVAKVGS
jgi:flagellar basal-body rod protein FlgF